MRGAGSADRLAEILRDYGLHPAVSLRPEPLRQAIPAKPTGLFVVVAGLRAGFELPEAGLVVFSEKEIFGEQPRGVERRARGRAAFVSDFRDLRAGDLVVHVDHGVARYRGLGRPSGGSLNRDFMVLEFAGGDRLFVPVDRLDLVQKYTGVGGRRPPLDRLGGPSWERVKARVRRSVEALARELLDLYARRKAAPGHAFSPDTAWQRELEASFPYELTPDQARALEEIKKDMESPHPMDRLLVGDVGFGKTEIAVRAAFKCVMDGYQAAVLAPTTVLAYQHLETFRERLAPFPVRVEMLSRFVSEPEARRVLAGVASGEVDIVIGTHRLLSKDVRFRRLGLLIVDEEQRFGVADKEKLKKLCLGVDVLAMTATPIPRTLQMSLAGVRDLSVIETAPKGRTAIRTYLVPFRKSVVAQAIRQELRRQGQVFVVHNRVETLPALARALQEIVPEARLIVAHGQMGERQLEQAMLRFYRYEADVIVTTTIVENGLDIPRANTILVHRADRFGLAQLYQLRGRVGRSEQPAYAYFIVPGRESLSEEARRRLRALKEFSELGSGFRLAAADLEIRGAGEFLGTRQHGHIASLGFDLYCQMLERAVAELRGEPVPERPPVSLHLGVDIKIPESYMPDMGDRLALYKRLASATEEAEVDRLQAETEDRYGHLPPAGRNLFDLARLRLVAESAGVRSVDVADARLEIRFHAPPPVEPRRVVELLDRERGRLTPSGMMVLPAPDRPSERIGAVREVLERISGKAA
jgi:transcription-repair coupling factor (superfamily II helicase)